MDWFECITGFSERAHSYEEIQGLLRWQDGWLHSSVNGKRYWPGTFELAQIRELRQAASHGKGSGTTKLSEQVADVTALHHNPQNANAVFQVASQFNMLEMVAPNVTPEAGVGIYEHDKTQGPACAICCGAGTIFRNYGVEFDDARGQTAGRQLNGLGGLSEIIPDLFEGWSMQNGYALPDSERALQRTTEQVARGGDEALRAALALGVQWNSAVTSGGGLHTHRVSQVYCAAMPIAYSGIHHRHWETVARLVLNATYEGTLWAAVANAQRTGCNRVFLTLVGGGVFGNPLEWILDAIAHGLSLVSDHGLDVRIVSYGHSKPQVAAFVR